jgi:hypothetical protein
VAGAAATGNATTQANENPAAITLLQE